MELRLSCIKPLICNKLRLLSSYNTAPHHCKGTKLIIPQTRQGTARYHKVCFANTCTKNANINVNWQVARKEGQKSKLNLLADLEPKQRKQKVRADIRYQMSTTRTFWVPTQHSYLIFREDQFTTDQPVDSYVRFEARLYAISCIEKQYMYKKAWLFTNDIYWWVSARETELHWWTWELRLPCTTPYICCVYIVYITIIEATNNADIGYIPRNKHTVLVLLCDVVVWYEPVLPISFRVTSLVLCQWSNPEECG